VLDIVDTHCHVVSEDTVKYPVNPIGGVRSGWSATRPVTFERFQQLTADSGVGRAVLVQSSTTYTYDNTYVADCIARAPERFAGVFTTDALAPDVADQMAYWVQDRGMSGTRFYTPADSFWLDKPEGERAWRAVAALGIPACVSSKRIGIQAVHNAVASHSEVPVLLDHMLKPDITGGPPFVAARDFLALASLPNIYLKLTSSNVQSYRADPNARQFLELVVETFGVERMMWGTNFPSTYGSDPADPYRELVEDSIAMLSFLGESDLAQVLSGTARKIYPRLGAQ
jgi:predicted TIM-barrel fold metal-dependent hydrolase